MIPQLPLDVLVNVLCCLPPVRHIHDPSASTLVACLQSNSILREAASIPALWKRHYDVRYEHCDAERERLRIEMFSAQQPNWRLMYAARKRIDNVVTKHMENLIHNRSELRRIGESVLDFSMDVWDVLDIESTLPVDGEGLPQHALTRRFWAKSLLRTLTRSRAMLLWRNFGTSNFLPNPTFEDTMNSLSGFFGYSNERILAQLDRLASHCRQHLHERGVVIYPGEHGFSSLILCRGICISMKLEGFIPPSSLQEYEIKTTLPHAYLSTHRQTIPISLVHVFAAIGSRLGLKVFPVNYPGTVLAYVVPKEDLQPIIVNPSSDVEQELAEVLSTSRALHLLPSLSLNPLFSAETYLKPCDGRLMLFRASRNIFGILPNTITSPNVYPCFLLVFCTHLLFQADNTTLQILVSTLKRRAQVLDCLFLLRDLQPALRPRCQKVLQRYCNDVLGVEDELAVTVRRRSVSKMKYFLGMPCRNSSGHLCFIYGWDRISLSDRADYDITPPLLSDRIEREAYHVLGTDGTDQLIFLPEGSITPTSFSKADVEELFENYPDAAVFFSGVEFPSDPYQSIDYVEGRGRLLLSPHARFWYPEDDDSGSVWIRSGIFSGNSL